MSAWHLTKWFQDDKQGWTLHVDLPGPAGEADARALARLYDAAPAMLEALKALLHEVEMYHQGGALPAEDLARAAIARAEGRGP